MLETFNFNFNAKLKLKSYIINNRNESPDARKRNVVLVKQLFEISYLSFQLLEQHFFK